VPDIKTLQASLASASTAPDKLAAAQAIQAFRENPEQGDAGEAPSAPMKKWLVTNTRGYRAVHEGATDIRAIQEGMGQVDYVLESSFWKAEPYAGEVAPANHGIWKYAMVNRPVGIGTAPKGYIGVDDRPPAGAPHHDMARHGILVYDRQLSAEETKSFELAPLVDDMEPLAKKVAQDKSEYAEGYTEAANAGEDWVRQNILTAAQELSPGFRPSLADPAKFVQMVLAKLAAMAPADPAPQSATPPAENDLTRLEALNKLAPKAAIYRDDPQALEKLQAKLAYLLGWQEFMKKANKLLKKGDDAGLVAMGFTESKIAALKKPDFAGRAGFADYMLTNNNGEIGRTRKRIQEMTDNMPAPTPSPEPEKPPVVVPEPVAPAADPQRKTDSDYLGDVIAGRVDLLDPELINRLEPLASKYAEDAEMMALVEAAANAYTEAVTAAAKAAQG
jgi:Defence against restriction A C-terminal